MNSVREIKEGPQEQGVEEVVIYTVSVPASWGTPNPSELPTVKVYSYNGSYTDVTETVITSGVVTLAGQIVKLPPIRALVAGVKYRVEIKIPMVEGDIKEPYAWLIGKK